tara:strand:- start:79 stop:330 length:252 start_codon:yes stop_codon:yes gene_type:complete
VINSLANEYAGRVRVGVLKIDSSDGADEISKTYNVKLLPSIFIFKDGKLLMGAEADLAGKMKASKPVIKKALDEVLAQEKIKK